MYAKESTSIHRYIPHYVFTPSCFGRVAPKAPRIFLGTIDGLLIDFLNIFNVSVAKITRILCAEGALIVKRPFPGSKVGNSGPDGYKSMFKISRNKKQSSKFLGYKNSCRNF